MECKLRMVIGIQHSGMIWSFKLSAIYGAISGLSYKQLSQIRYHVKAQPLLSNGNTLETEDSRGEEFRALKIMLKFVSIWCVHPYSIRGLLSSPKMNRLQWMWFVGRSTHRLSVKSFDSHNLPHFQKSTIFCFLTSLETSIFSLCTVFPFWGEPRPENDKFLTKSV